MAKRLPVLEVHPVGIMDEWQVRLRASNGKIRFYSGDEGYNKTRALRAARTFNDDVALGRLQIRVMNRDGVPIRVIEPKAAG